MTAHAVFRRVMPTAGAATIAWFIYALDDAHAMAVAWVCGRHLLIAPLLVFVAWYCHLRSRDEGGRSGAALSVVCWVAALLASESALALLPLVWLEQIIEYKNHKGRRTLQIWTLCAGMWLLAYAAMGYGAHGQDLYVSPWSDPQRFVELAALRIPALMTSAVAWFFPDLVILLESRPAAAWTLAIVLATALAIVLRFVYFRVPEPRRRAWLGYIAASAWACTVCSAGPVQDRVSTVTGVGVALAFGLTWAPTSEQLQLRSWRQCVRELWVQHTSSRMRALIVVHLVLAPILLPLRTAAHGVFAEIQNSPAWSLADTTPPEYHEFVIFVRSPGPLRGEFSLAMLRGAGRPSPLTSATMSSGHEAVDVVRTSETELCIRTEGSELASVENRAIRSRSLPHTPKLSFERRGVAFDAQPLQSEDGPRTVCARWHSPGLLERAWLVHWTDDGFRSLHLPAVGEEIRLPATDPMPKAVPYEDW